MTVTIDKSESGYIMTIDGDLTVYTSEEYWKYIDSNLVHDMPVQLNLEKVDEIDTCGIQLLAAITLSLAKHGHDMEIISSNPAVDEAIAITGFVCNTIYSEEVSRA